MEQDCSKCTHSAKMEEASYKLEDDMQINVYGGPAIKCTKEKVASISFINGEMKCSDFELK